ncbi:MAG: DNA repair protein RecO [Candidatus Omnitrophica bacterium]|nr:DNA repair protein RecO [Candidatus Omnitrophota bacterium]
MPLYKSEAVILNTKNFRQTSVIIDFYTRDFGRINGILKGARELPPKFGSNLDLLTFNEIIFYKSRTSSLHLVSQCDLRKDYPVLKKDIKKLKKAYRVVELLNLLTCAEDKNEAVFQLLVSSLDVMENEKLRDLEKYLLIFKIKLLDLVGFRPHLDSCICCNDKIRGNAKFSLKLGGLICERCRLRDYQARNIFRGSIASILYIERNNFESALRLGMNWEIKKELERIVNAFLEFHVK